MEKASLKDIEEMLEDTRDIEIIKEELKSDKRVSVKKLIEKYERKLIKENEAVLEYKKRMKYENYLISKNIRYIAGIDEVGRGPLAGPVYAAAVILDNSIIIPGIKDSKKLSPKAREKLSVEIKKKSIAYSIGYANVEEIDSLNILNATKLAMRRAIGGLKIKPQYILIDALTLDDINIPQKGIIKGDDLSVSIGAASIIAKVERDKLMDELSLKYPEYMLDKNKGYGTSEHIASIKKYGICKIHRKTFVQNFI